MESPLAFLGGLGLAILGFLGRSLWDIVMKRRESLRDLQIKGRIDRLEKQLSQFYWPIYLRLIQNEATWERILGPGDAERARTLRSVFEREIILPNHAEIVARLQSGSYLADADYDFRRLIADYLHHVAVYRSLRDAGDDRLPAQAGAPFPQRLSREFETRTLTLQAEYDTLLERRVIAEPDSKSMFRDLEREAEEQMEALGLKPRG
jgi:hypothetical protein